MPFRCALGRLTLIRHGQSTANVLFARAERENDPDLTVPEGIDIRVGLSPFGVRQAAATGEWLAGLEPSDRPQIVVCSPYVRARRTWEVLAEAARGEWAACPEPLVDERLRDRETGVIELMTPPAVRAYAPREAERRDLVGDWYYRPPGGESLADVTVRVRDLLRELGEGASGRHVALVAHDAVVMAVDQVLAGVGAPPPDLVPVPNASVTRWDGDGTTMRLVARGDVGHLRGIG
ncbi:histidine phosphatase family protein [Actinacidiphila yeochonensis]|uniref:histidine phosphatase family protein n=1 Tax=Actinacidiphila yeochonensis TaxID=89050 RepID=UPI00055B2695|nr:histidine phosphatase family protein [Actinacidiphila yeochonensis]